MGNSPPGGAEATGRCGNAGAGAGPEALARFHVLLRGDRRPRGHRSPPALRRRFRWALRQEPWRRPTLARLKKPFSAGPPRRPSVQKRPARYRCPIHQRSIRSAPSSDPRRCAPAGAVPGLALGGGREYGGGAPSGCLASLGSLHGRSPCNVWLQAALRPQGMPVVQALGGKSHDEWRDRPPALRRGQRGSLLMDRVRGIQRW